MKPTFPKLDYAEIYEKYPLSVEKIVDWFCANEDIVKGMLQAEGDIRMDEMKNVMWKTVPMVIQFDPRKLYEFFDSRGIFINILGHPEKEGAFTCHNSKERVSEVGENRIEAEEKAFMRAFSILEKELAG